MSFFFVPLVVGIMQYFDILKLNWLEIVVVTIVSTLVTLVISGLVAKRGTKNE